MKAYELSLATSGDQAMVAWHGGVAGPDAIFLQQLDFAGRPAGGPRQITDGQRYAYEPDLQFIAGDALLAWYEKDVASGELTAWLARTDRDGRNIWRRQLNAENGYARNPVVRISAGTISVAWIETMKGQTPAVWVGRFSADGSPDGAPRRIGAASSDTWNLNATIDAAGTLYVAYDAQLGTQANELRLLAVRPDKVIDLALSADDGFESVYPDIGISESGMAALTWFDSRDGNAEIYLAVLPLTDLLSAASLPAVRVTHTPGESIGAYLAWNGDRLALVWCDAVEGRQELYLQIVRDDETTVPIRRLTHAHDQSSIPSIRPFGSGYSIAWNEYRSAGQGTHRDIIASDAKLTVLP